MTKDVVAMMWNDDERWRMHDQAGAGWLMVVLMLVVVIAVVVVAVALLRGTVPTAAGTAAATPGRAPGARAILQERFARGEIDEQDFRSRMRALDEEGPGTG